MKNLLLIAGAIILAIVVYFIVLPKQITKPLGGGSTLGGPYISTTTSQAMVTASGFQLLKTGGGVLGSVVITNVSAFPFNLYDGTTTVNGAVYGTTTLAKFGASVAAGDYVFDVAFSKGLILEYTGQASLASTTITIQ